MNQDTRTVNIEVYCESAKSGKDVFAVLTEHRSDLPKPFNEQIQEFASEAYGHLDVGDSIVNAGILEYVPNGEIVDIRMK